MSPCSSDAPPKRPVSDDTLREERAGGVALASTMLGPSILWPNPATILLFAAGLLMAGHAACRLGVRSFLRRERCAPLN